MNLTPIKKPTFALSLSEDALYVVEAKQSWGATRLRQIRQVPLPSGTIRLSSAKLNIENEEVFIAQLRNLVEPLKKPIPIAVSLPDLCARTNVFDFSTFPAKKAEQTALLTWRFQQDLKLDATQSRLAYGHYVYPASSAKPQNHDAPSVQVLGSVIRNDIVEQYEHACLAVNLMPLSISISGLDVFDLYQATLQETLQLNNKRNPNVPTGGMFLFISHWGFTFLAFSKGCPTFIRTKAMSIRPEPKEVAESMNLARQDQYRTSPHSVEEPKAKTDQQESNINHNPNPYSPYTARKAEKEILATLQYYFENCQQDSTLGSTTHFFVVSDLEHGHLLLPPNEDIDRTARISSLTDSPIIVTQLAYPKYLAKTKRRFAQKSSIGSALPGYASLRVA